MKEEFLAAASGALKGGVLDDEVYDGHILWAFRLGHNTESLRNIDLPIRDLVSLSPEKKFYQSGETWRQVVHGLKYDRWLECRDDVIGYFNNELHDKLFPAPGSHGYFSVGFVGGASYVRVGNHRAAAMKAWLAYHIGEDAILKSTPCTFNQVIPDLQKLMQCCLNNGSTLKYFWVPQADYFKRAIDWLKFDYFKQLSVLRNYGYRNIVLVEHPSTEPEIYWIKDEESLVPIKKNRWSLLRFLRMNIYQIAKQLNYQVVPPTLMRLMLDETKVNAFLND